MPLNPRQLKLVFAKLRAKGLLKYIKKGQRKMAGPASASSPTIPQRGQEILKSIFSEEKARWLESRIPDSHKRLSTFRELKIWDGYVNGEPEAVGLYEMFTGKMHLSRSPIAYATKKGYGRLPLHRPAGSIRSNARYVRNAKIGSAKAFYHEYGHSIYGNVPREVRNSFPAVGEWDNVERPEAFSEAYGWYATSKVSRNRLKQERPLTYKYMKRFFEES